jgi:hypothetical protein
LKGKKEEWSTLNEKFLTKVRRGVVKDILTGMLNIPKTKNEINKKTRKTMFFEDLWVKQI